MRLFAGFETPVPEKSELLRHCTTAPHLFILEPQELLLGDVLEFGLTLIGRAIDLLPWFLLVFEELGRSGGNSEP
ncbi:hypothetical protein [Candidatus Electronema sp. JM]|uniref:hypothetical protein n=1 Tax=Candidatus Electronema sp. JM TaxID=3401571 RepID=UPI003AA8EFA2